MRSIYRPVVPFVSVVCLTPYTKFNKLFTDPLTKTLTTIMNAINLREKFTTEFCDIYNTSMSHLSRTSLTLSCT